MKDNGKKEFVPYDIQFGQITVKLKFITEEQLKDALYEQIKDDISHRPHRFLGEILVAKGWMTYEQVEIALDKQQEDRKKNEELI